ncbi:hypothetical protein ACNHUS_34815 [Actinomycetes bacterium M1A6_2h]
MTRALVLALSLVFVTSVTACGSSDADNGAATTTESAASTAATTTVAAATPTVDVDYYEQNLPIVAGNVVVTIRNAKDQGIENTPPGDVYDPGAYYGQMTTECQAKTTRSMVREDFINRIFPLVDEGPTERTTVTINGTEAVAKVEQLSGITLVMNFDVSTTSEKHLCNADGTIAIAAG